jgi:hypothetical protein
MTPDFAVSTGPANFLLITPGPSDLFAAEHNAQKPSAVHHIKMPDSEGADAQALKASIKAFEEHERSRHTHRDTLCAIPPEHYFEIHPAEALIAEEEWLCTEEEAYYDSVPVQVHDSLEAFFQAIGFDQTKNCYIK